MCASFFVGVVGAACRQHLKKSCQKNNSKKKHTQNLESDLQCLYYLLLFLFIYFLLLLCLSALSVVTRGGEHARTHTERERDRQTHTHIQRVREKKTHAVETDTVKLRRGALSRCSQLQRPHNTVRSRASDARRQRYCGRAANNDDVGSDAAECATKTRRDETTTRPTGQHDRHEHARRQSQSQSD